jgi:uncharacterized membrane protein
LSWPLRQKWFWMLFIVLTSMLLLPLLIFWVVITLSPSSLFAMLIAVAALWVVVRAYRKWHMQKDESEGSETEEQNGFLHD